MSRVQLSQCKFKGADMREAIVEGIDLKSLDLQGVRMDMEQAVLLARSFGAKVGN